MSEKPIRYCQHLEDRLHLRHIEREVPARIIREAPRLFRDVETGYHIAVATAVYRGADHLMMVAFEETQAEILAITTHPLDERDVQVKIRMGRWIPC
ncbi:MAG: hypothetical protein FJ279_02910 [Planctomycetes bacterium]|nr:hypothetical protein [Planctomycetota bacterium]